MKKIKFNQSIVNRYNKIDKILTDENGPNGWTKELAALWVERNKLSIELKRMA